jgi:hypothetical protein
MQEQNLVIQRVGTLALRFAFHVVDYTVTRPTLCLGPIAIAESPTFIFISIAL